MSEIKHTGEKMTGVTVKIRFVPLKVENETNYEPVTISVCVDDTKRGTMDNLMSLEIPKLPKLEHEGETFVQNNIKLINTIFEPKGWTTYESLPTRLKNMAC